MSGAARTKRPVVVLDYGDRLTHVARPRKPIPAEVAAGIHCLVVETGEGALSYADLDALIETRTSLLEDAALHMDAEQEDWVQTRVNQLYREPAGTRPFRPAAHIRFEGSLRRVANFDTLTRT